MLDQVVQCLVQSEVRMSSQHIQGHLEAHCNTKNGTLLASALCWDSDVIYVYRYSPHHLGVLLQALVWVHCLICQKH